MMKMLILVFVYYIGSLAGSKANQICSWTHYPQTALIGSETSVTSLKGNLAECQAACLSSGGSCQSIGISSLFGSCTLHKFKSGKIFDPVIEHYDYDCKDPCSPNPCQNNGTCNPSGQIYQCSCRNFYTGTNCETLILLDVVATTRNTSCFTTNYPGPITDLYTKTDGVTWNFQIATFGFDWPPTSLLSIPLGQLVSVERITFTNSNNMDYFRVAFQKNDGQVITTKPITANDKDVVLNDVNNVKRVDFYLASVDYNQNVSITDISLKCCFKNPVLGTVSSCFLFDVVKFAANQVPLGIISVGGTSETFSVSKAQDYPFIELDLACATISASAFYYVSFGQSSNFDTVVINAWLGDNQVTVYRNDSVAINAFNTQNINFGGKVPGTRFRSTLIPNPVPNQGISGSLHFSKYSVYATV